MAVLWDKMKRYMPRYMVWETSQWSLELSGDLAKALRNNVSVNVVPGPHSGAAAATPPGDKGCGQGCGHQGGHVDTPSWSTAY